MIDYPMNLCIAAYGDEAAKVLKGLTEEQMAYFCSDEYRRFYITARNLSTQSINVDKCSVYFYGIIKNDD